MSAVVVARYRATVQDVSLSLRSRTATVYLDGPFVGVRVPKWLMFSQPPAQFDSIKGVELTLTNDAIYVGGKLWAKRISRYNAVLIAKGKDE